MTTNCVAYAGCSTWQNSIHRWTQKKFTHHLTTICAFSPALRPATLFQVSLFQLSLGHTPRNKRVLVYQIFPLREGCLRVPWVFGNRILERAFLRVTQCIHPQNRRSYSQPCRSFEKKKKKKKKKKEKKKKKKKKKKRWYVFNRKT